MEKKKRDLERETVEDKEQIKIDEPEDILETEPEKKSKGIILAQFFTPWLIALIEISLLWVFLDNKTFVTLGFWMLLYFFPPFGKETVIPLGISGEAVSAWVPFFDPETFIALDPLLIALAIASIDIIVGLFLVWNFDLTKKIPILGRYIRKFEKKGEDILARNKYIEALSFIGVTLFVIVPFQGSGAVGASIIGRMIGMDPYKVWGAVIVGAISGCLMIAYAFNTFKAIFQANWIVGVVLLIVILCISAFYLIKRRRRTEEKDDEAEE
ncbi:MAG: small multi-drug export protein [Thermoplasmata archaeon]|nr:MAG: small multi-drug export protein [Thermoplasmata archaeon]